MFGIRILSGAIIAGAGGKALSDGLFATGSLRGYAFLVLKKVMFVHNVIQFNNVTFSYPDEEEPILENLTLSIRHGERVVSSYFELYE